MDFICKAKRYGLLLVGAALSILDSIEVPFLEFLVALSGFYSCDLPFIIRNLSVYSSLGTLRLVSLPYQYKSLSHKILGRSKLDYASAHCC